MKNKCFFFLIYSAAIFYIFHILLCKFVKIISSKINKFLPGAHKVQKYLFLYFCCCCSCGLLAHTTLFALISHLVFLVFKLLQKKRDRQCNLIKNVRWSERVCWEYEKIKYWSLSRSSLCLLSQRWGRAQTNVGLHLHEIKRNM